MKSPRCGYRGPILGPVSPLPRPDRRALLAGGLRLAGTGAALRLAGPWGRSLLGLTSLDLASAISTAVAAPPIITRAQWGADERRRGDLPNFHPVRKFVIHHTATPNRDPDPAGRVRSIYGSHLNREDGAPWVDIGYNFLVDEAGRIFEGRFARNYAAGEAHDGEDPYGRGVRGAHAGEWNGGAVGIALIGTYTSGRPTDAALDAVADVIAWKCSRHGLDPTGVEPWTASDGATRVLPTIVGHRDLRSTGCPGNGMYALLGHLRQRVADRLAGTTAQAWSRGPGGYRMVHATGDVTPFGAVSHLGALPTRGVSSPVTSAAPVPGHDAFWMVDADGGVHGFGGAPYFGSLPALRLAGATIGQSVVVRIAARSAAGYWLLDRHGGVFGFADAPFLGSVPGLRASGTPIDWADIVALEPTLDGTGYWILDRNGGVFTFGSARFHGSIPQLAQQGVVRGDTEVTDIKAAPGGGYWVLDRRGGVFAFGGAPFHGSVPATGFVGGRAVRIVPTADGGGYLILSEDGGVMPFGNAVFHGHGPHFTAVDLIVSG